MCFAEKNNNFFFAAGRITRRDRGGNKIRIRAGERERGRKKMRIRVGGRGRNKIRTRRVGERERQV